MAAEQINRDGEAPPPGEAIHLPGPSYLPVLVAAGLTVALVGVVMNWWVFGAGIALMLVSTGRWIADTRRDISELPLEHH